MRIDELLQDNRAVVLEYGRKEFPGFGMACSPSASITTWEHANRWDLLLVGSVSGSREEGELVPKLVWRVKLVVELHTGVTTEVEVGPLERD